ncbi:MAG: hypothetical protein RSA79_00975, partial [Oscillospiraceae bacterium]
SEVASSTLKTVSQAAELLAKLFKFLLTRGRKSGSFYDEKLKKEEAKNLKSLNKERAISLKYAGRSGEISAKKLQMMSNQHNDKIYCPNVKNMSDASYVKLCEKMKNRGVLFTAIIEKTSGTRIFQILDSDKNTFNEVLQELEVDRLLVAKNKEIEELTAKETLTPEEQKRLDELLHEKDVILCNEVTSENKKSIDEVFDNVAENKKSQARNFDDTVNHFTDRGFQKNEGEPYYACDRKNPKSYMEMRESKDIFHDKEYRKTDFKVFKDGVEQKSDICKDGKFNDARFEGRPKYFWLNVRKEMKQKGEFSDDMVMFANKKDFEKYQNLYEKSIKENTIDVSNNIQSQLKEQLTTRGAKIDEQGTLIDIKKNEPITKDNVLKTVNIDEKVRLNECLIIQKQMQNYKEMAIAKSNITLAKAEYDEIIKQNGSIELGNIPHGEDFDKIVAEIKENSEKLNSCEKIESDLNVQRNDLSYVDVINEVDTDRQIELNMIEPPEQENEKFDHSELNEALNEMDTMEQYEVEIEKRQSARANVTPNKIEIETVKETTHIDRSDR